MDALRRLDVLLGEWTTSGLVWDAPESEPREFTASDRYEWMPGGHFLAHHVRARMGGDTEIIALEIGRVDGDGYLLQSYDNLGGYQESRAWMDGDQWTIRGEDERFTGTVAEDSVDGVWERRLAGEWVRWMEVRLVRAQLAVR